MQDSHVRQWRKAALACAASCSELEQYPTHVERSWPVVVCCTSSCCGYRQSSFCIILQHIKDCHGFLSVSENNMLHSMQWSKWINICTYQILKQATHYGDVIMGAMVSQITSLTIVYSNVYSSADKKKTSKFGVTGLCAGKSLLISEFPAQRASNAGNVSIWWHHHALMSQRCLKWQS